MQDDTEQRAVDLDSLVEVAVVLDESFLNLFMKKFTRERVMPIISDSVSWEMVATTWRGFVCY